MRRSTCRFFLASRSPLEIIPVFERTGAIVPMSPAVQYVDKIRNVPYEIRVGRGADGCAPQRVSTHPRSVNVL